MDDALKQTLLAKVYDAAIETPLQRATKLSEQIGREVYLKREDLQPIHSFKIRGAYNKIANLTPAELEAGVIAASAGNHAQGVAMSADKLGISALIIMPRTTPAIKVEAVKSYGARVELAGDSYSDAAEYCKQRVEETGRTYIAPFDDPLVIAGQATIAREILEQSSDVTHIFVPVGGGGLIAGIAQYVKLLKPDIKIIGVQSEDANTLGPALERGKRIVLSHVGIFSDGTAVKQLGEHTYSLITKYVDGFVTVNTDQICAAIKSIFEDTRSIVEPAGALAVAGLQAMAAGLPVNANCIAICSGANMTFERLQFVAERTLLGSGKEALFAVRLLEQSGALRQFCNDVIEGYAITEFSYRLNDRKEAYIFVGVGVPTRKDSIQFIANLKKHAYEYSDMSLDELAKEHIRHMVGGNGSQARHERFYDIQFPERPGALNEFLQTIGDVWNISLFHYRGQGGDSGKVFISFEAEDKAALEQKLAATGYDFTEVTSLAANHFCEVQRVILKIDDYGVIRYNCW